MKLEPKKKLTPATLEPVSGSQSKSVDKLPLVVAIKHMQAIPEIADILDDAAAIRIDFAKIRKEVKEYTVTSMNLETGVPERYGVDSTLQNPLKDLRDIASVQLKIQGWRDRVVAIYGMLHAKQVQLTKLKHRANYILKVKYLTGAKGEKTPVQERIDLALYDLVLKREEVTSAMEAVNLIANNLTNSYYNYKNIGDLALSLQGQMERRGGRDYRD